MPEDRPSPPGEHRVAHLGDAPEETMHERTAVATRAGDTRAGPTRAGAARLWRDVRSLAAATVEACMRFRVTGLAAEGGFFALLSLPPLVFGIVASLGYLGRWLGGEDVAAAREQLRSITEASFTPQVISDVILPTFDSVTTGGRADLTLLAFAVSVWSGSRALNVYVDTIAIMYGLGGHRGIVRTRLLSLSTYLVGLLVSVVVVPLVLVGPSELSDWLPAGLGFLSDAYWPVVLLLSVFGLAALYHLSTPVRSRWWRDVPGALLAVLGWLGTSYVLRWVLSASVGGGSTSIYGPLATPVVVLVWFYFLAIAVLIGAGLNSAVDRVWPDPTKTAAREAARVQAADRRRWVP